MDEIMLLGEDPLPLLTFEITQEDEGENKWWRFNFRFQNNTNLLLDLINGLIGCL